MKSQNTLSHQNLPENCIIDSAFIVFGIFFASQWWSTAHATPLCTLLISEALAVCNAKYSYNMRRHGCHIVRFSQPTINPIRKKNLQIYIESTVAK